MALVRPHGHRPTPSAAQIALEMNQKPPWRAAPVLVLAFAGASQAAPAASAAPTTVSGLPTYESAFSDYKPWQDLKPGNWRALNDALVAGAPGQGGLGTAAAATTAGQATNSAQPAPAQKAPGAGHDAHHMHGGRK
jgi:hypothetical protein